MHKITAAENIPSAATNFISLCLSDLNTFYSTPGTVDFLSVNGLEGSYLDIIFLTLCELLYCGLSGGALAYSYLLCVCKLRGG